MWILVFTALIAGSLVNVTVEYDNGNVCKVDADRIVALGVTQKAACEPKDTRGS